MIAVIIELFYSSMKTFLIYTYILLRTGTLGSDYAAGTFSQSRSPPRYDIGKCHIVAAPHSCGDILLNSLTTTTVLAHARNACPRSVSLPGYR